MRRTLPYDCAFAPCDREAEWPRTSAYPFTLDDLLAEDFDSDTALTIFAYAAAAVNKIAA